MLTYRKKPKRKKRYIFGIVLVFGIAILGVVYLKDKKDVPVVQNIAEKVEKVAAVKKTKNISELEQKLNTIITENPKIETSIAFIDLETGKTYIFGQATAFRAASTTKVLTAAAILSEVEKGKISLDSPLGSYTVGWQLKQMVNQSNNVSWELLNSKLGYSKLIAYAKSFGLSSYDFYNNQISAADEANLLNLLYSRKLLNEENTKLLLSYMTNTNNEDLIAGALKGKTVYHKYGNLGAALHDAAIITGEHPYILTIYTDSTALYYDQRVEYIHQITGLVDDFQNQ